MLSKMRVKLIIIYILCLGIVLNLTSQCTNISLYTQSDVDNFSVNYPSCSNPSGNIYIDGTNINNLNGLSALNTIGGYFIITNTSLVNLSGLNNVISIGEYFTVFNNNSLINFSGIDNLHDVGGLVDIRFNPILVNLNGLNSLATVGLGGAPSESYLWIHNNQLLLNISDLNTLSHVGGSLTINNNNSLNDCHGLTNLNTVIGSLFIQNNCNTLPNLSNSITLGGLVIDNTYISDFGEFNNVTNLNGSITISNNDNLINFSGLEQLNQIDGYLHINNNSILNSLQGLDNIDPSSINHSLITDIVIKENPQLSICNIESICNAIEISSTTADIQNNSNCCNSISEVQNSCSNISCINNCMDLDGVNDLLQRTNLSTNGDFTISAWLNADVISNNGDEDRIIAFGSTNRLEIGIEQGGIDDGKLWLYDQYLGTEITFGPNIRDGQWHHVALAFTGFSNSIYLDGVLQGSYGTSPSSFGPNLRVGNWTGGGSTAFFSGKIDDVAIWNYALGASDIASMMTCELDGSEFGLNAFWDFNIGISEGNNGSITTIPDQTTNGNDLTVFNLAMNGNNSNLVSSTTGVFENCNLCYTPPIASCNTNMTFSFAPSVGFVTINASEINNGSMSVCGGNLTYSFDAAGTVLSITYDCSDIGSKNLILYVTDVNGLQSSCNTSFEIDVNEPTFQALRDIYEATGGPLWANTIADNLPWFQDCDPCGKIDGTEWFGIDCKVNSTLDDIVIDKLFLQNNNLDGTLPDAFGAFDQITWFYVFGNPNLEGNIPPSFCEMSTLQLIGLGNTSIGLGSTSPTFPSNCFLNFNQLSTFGTAHNTNGHFKGPLPEFSPLAPLVNLYFDHNQYSGSIPESYCFLNLAPNTTLRLNNNPNLTGCYDPCFYRYCTGFPNFINTEISANTSLPLWSDFCSGTACCLPSLTIDWTPIFSGTYKSSGDIILLSPVGPGINLNLNHGTNNTVQIPAGVTLSSSANVNISNTGCN